MSKVDAVIVGAGPNGLSAGIALARAGLSVRIYEAAATVGGAARSAAFDGSDCVYDTCSAIHPLGAASPFWRTLPLSEHGLEWIEPPVAAAHPFNDRPAACLFRSLDRTCEELQEDGGAWRRAFEQFVDNADSLIEQVLGPPRVPKKPVLLARFGLSALRSARGFADHRFQGVRARGLFAGLAGHSVLPLEQTATSAIALMLAIGGHRVGWPLPRGGAQSISNALAAYFMSLGGEIELGRRVASVAELPAAKATLLDLNPHHVVRLLGERLSSRGRRSLNRFRLGPGVFKLDWLLREPAPFREAACRQAGTVHLGGTFEEIADAEAAVAAGRHPERPFVLFAQQSLFDPSRVSGGRQVGWAYCHVPNGSAVDMTDAIERQMERFAPGFRDCIEQRVKTFPADLEARNANCIGGDITGGAQDVRQVLMRPTARLRPYRLPAAGYYICSASTPPGGGVHGMCGFHAAATALRDRFPHAAPPR